MNIETFFPVQHRHVRFLLGQYLGRKRHELGHSLEEVASYLGITSRKYNGIEKGQFKISPEIFRKLDDLFSFDEKDLFEIRKIAGIRYVNDLSKNIGPNYPA